MCLTTSSPKLLKAAKAEEAKKGYVEAYKSMDYDSKLRAYRSIHFYRNSAYRSGRWYAADGAIIAYDNRGDVYPGGFHAYVDQGPAGWQRRLTAPTVLVHLRGICAAGFQRDRRQWPTLVAKEMKIIRQVKPKGKGKV